jgi:hypothetical protein
MTPILTCEYIIAVALGLSGAFFVIAGTAALVNWLFGTTMKRKIESSGDDKRLN